MEYWDLLDENRCSLNIKHARGERLPAGTYHQIVFSWVVSKDGKFLATKRSPEKPWGNYWENTGGSVVCGETQKQGMVRELLEETGVRVDESDLILLKQWRDKGTFADQFLTIVDRKDQRITLQQGETIDYRWLSWDELNAMIEGDEFAVPVANRFYQCKELLLECLSQHDIEV